MNQKGFGGFIWRQHVGMIMAILDPKRTTIHLNPAPPGKTHNPPSTPLPNTRDPPLDRQQEEKKERNGTLKARDKTKQWAALPSSPDPA